LDCDGFGTECREVVIHCLVPPAEAYSIPHDCSSVSSSPDTGITAEDPLMIHRDARSGLALGQHSPEPHYLSGGVTQRAANILIVGSNRSSMQPRN
jgi:hypothetical protein